MKKSIPAIPLFLAFLCMALTLTAQEITVQELATDWSLYGDGMRKVEGRAFYMKENPGSKGVMVVSPEMYGGDIKVTYELMPLSPVTVCVFVLNASDKGEGESLTLPGEYDGSMGPWFSGMHHYFFAFHNAAHDRKPFLIKLDDKETLDEAEENVMRVGKFYQIEVERKAGVIRLTVDGNLLLEGKDEDPLGPGHLAFRIRGISEETASCLIRNVRIEKIEP